MPRMTALTLKKAVLPLGQDQVQKAHKKAVTLQAALNTTQTSIQPTMRSQLMANTRQWYPQLLSFTSTKQKCVRIGNFTAHASLEKM